MNFFVDVDYTLISASGLLRPHAREMMAQLTGRGHGVFIWSGTGIRRGAMSRHGLSDLVSDFFVKPVADYEAALRRSDIPVLADMVVDDHTEIVEALGGVSVRPYFFQNDRDSELLRAARVLLEYADTGRANDSKFRPPPGRRMTGER
ncbi:MAG: hypothetical protein ACOC5K_00365 [Chloroflexota bacterium]